MRGDPPPTEKATNRSSTTGGRSNEEKDPQSMGRRMLNDIDASLSRAADIVHGATCDASVVRGETVGDYKSDRELELAMLNQSQSHHSENAGEKPSTTPLTTSTTTTTDITMSGCRNNMHDTARVAGITTLFDELEGQFSATCMKDSATTNASSFASTCYRARRWLFVSHALAQFSEIAWQFTVTIVLAAHTNYQSLLYVSTYGLSVSLAVCVGVTPLGRSIDDAAHRPHGRLRLARWLIGLENVIVLVGTLCCYNLLGGLIGSSSKQLERNPTEVSWSTSSLDTSNVSTFNTVHETLHDSDRKWSMLWIILIHVLGSLAQILDQAFLVAMERDWIVVLSQSAADASSMAKADPTAAFLTSAEAVAVPQTGLHSPQSCNVQIHRTRDPSVLSMWLSDTNVGMKQIDLLCKVAAPTVIGWLLPDQGVEAAATTTTTMDQPSGPNRSTLQYLCLGVGLLNVCALVVEYVCTAQVYHWIPALGRASADSLTSATYQPLEKTDPTAVSWLPTDDDENYDGYGKPTVTRSSSSIPPSSEAVTSNTCWSEWLIYWHQPIAGAGLALALLYVNALTFGNGILTAYLLSRGMDMSWIGIWRGVAAAIGLLGTCVFHWAMHHHYALHTTAFSSVVFQVACLGGCLVSLAVASVDPRSGLSLVLLIGGVCFSRIGLWVFDIAVTQMQQEEIPDYVRGRVGGVQQALNSFFRLLSFVSTLLYPNPSEFYISVTAGFSGVALAALSFGVGVFWPRHANYLSVRPLPVDQDEEGSSEFVD